MQITHLTYCMMLLVLLVNFNEFGKPSSSVLLSTVNFSGQKCLWRTQCTFVTQSNDDSGKNGSVI